MFFLFFFFPFLFTEVVINSRTNVDFALGIYARSKKCPYPGRREEKVEVNVAVLMLLQRNCEEKRERENSSFSFVVGSAIDLAEEGGEG